MNQFRLILLISVFIGIIFIFDCVESRRIIWQQRTNMADAENWEGETMPCASDALLFPQQNHDLLKLSNFTMKELILPKNGEFILSKQTSLNFRESDSKCRPNVTRIYKGDIKLPWLSTDNWAHSHESGTNPLINAATPHDERIPCDNDEIIFPINNSYVVDLQSLPILTFKSIAVEGRVMSVNEFKDFLSSSHGQESFKNIDNTLITESSCNDGDRCVCHQKDESLRQILCENENPFCQPTPHCSDPIKPIGHCCSVCGAMFQMKINSIKNFNLDVFRSKIESGKLNAFDVISSKISFQSLKFHQTFQFSVFNH
jgi:protein amnionless